MKAFNNTELTRELQKVIDLVLNSVQEGEPIDIAKNKIEEEAGNASFVIDIEDLAFFYHSEQERDEDFETLRDYISFPESKEIETQEIEVMVKITFEAKATLNKSEIEEEAKARINELKSPSIQLLDFIECDIIEIKEEAEIYGND